MTARRHLPSELIIGVVGPYDLVERIMLSGAAARDETLGASQAGPGTHGGAARRELRRGTGRRAPARARRPATGSGRPGTRHHAARRPGVVPG